MSSLLSSSVSSSSSTSSSPSCNFKFLLFFMICMPTCEGCRKLCSSHTLIHEGSASSNMDNADYFQVSAVKALFHNLSPPHLVQVFLMEVESAEEEGNRDGSSAVGSKPPTCASKCKGCKPCTPVRVSVPPGNPTLSEYYPEAWRCKCHDHCKYLFSA